MTKETLTLQGIINDLSLVAHYNQYKTEEWRFAYIVPSAAFAMAFWLMLKSIWLALLLFAPAVYHIVRYLMEYKKYRAEKKALNDVICRGDISISVEKLSHIAEETVYEPHRHGRHTHATKQVTMFYFNSGAGWRVPQVFDHYAWSAEYHLSTEGLKNVSVSGNDFFYITLQGYHDVAYVYPCKLFELDSRLKLQNDP